MQDTGLLTRRPAEHDRRVSVNHLTAKGESMREPIAAMWRELDDVTTANLTARQRTTLVTTAHTIVTSINSRLPSTGTNEGDPPRSPGP